MQQEKEEKIRKRLEKERATLIQGDRPTNKLRKVLEEIFAMYADTASSEVDEELSLNYTMASRLWYRCNLKLAYLDYILKAKVDKVPGLCVKDFLSLIEQVIKDDETEIQTKRPLPSGDFTSTVSSFEVRYSTRYRR